MTAVCFYFQVHQPHRLRRYSVFDIGRTHDYFDERKNAELLARIARKCYLPANTLILRLINQTGGAFRIAYSITGTALEQLELYAPDSLTSFQKLADSGAVEFLGEAYYHSLAWLYSRQDYSEQLRLHRKAIKRYFSQKPRVLRNTELIYNNEFGAFAEEQGYKAVLAEGWDAVLGWRSPNFVYRPLGARKTRLLLKNYRLSDDVAFRFSNREWSGWPLTAEKYAAWIAACEGQTVNLFMDYETFGEHQWPETGIFDFLASLPQELLRYRHLEFMTPGEVAQAFEPVAELDVPQLLSWADLERDLSAWTGNRLQQSALAELYRLEVAIKATGDEKLLEDWRRLQTSDHFYYMCLKWFADGDVHKYFNPYDTPYEAYITFMNIINDLQQRVKHTPKQLAVLKRLAALIKALPAKSTIQPTLARFNKGLA